MVALARAPEPAVLWRPNPGPQSWLLQCPVEDVFYGGARGGGKTDGALGDFALHAQRYGAQARGILFRRTYPELEDVIRRSRELYAALGATWSASERTWHFPNGGTLRMRYLDHDSDADHYQGHAYTWMCFEEAGNWPTPEPLDKLRACLRTAVGGGVRIRLLLTGNPGGIGHFWLKKRYIDPSKPMQPFRVDLGDGMTFLRVFIPAKLDDNPHLTQNDPGYRARLRLAGPGWLVKAWLDGDWTGPPVGGFFQPGWLHTYRGGFPDEVIARYLSVDLAAGRRNNSDCTAILPGGMTAKREVYVHPSLVIARMTPRAAALKMLDLADELEVEAILVEHGHLWLGMSESFEELMHERHEEGYDHPDGRRRHGGLYHIEEMPTKVEGGKGKRGRAQGLAVMMEHSRWYWPAGEVFETVVKPHVLAFTGDPDLDEPDDEIDAAAHLALYLNRMVSGEKAAKPKDRTLERENERRTELKRRARREADGDDYRLFRGGVDDGF